MSRIQFITKPESERDDAPTILRIEVDAEGLAALNAIVVAVQNGGDGMSRKIEANVWVNGESMPAFMTAVPEVAPIRRRTLTRDVIIALAIILICLALVVSAFIFNKSGSPAAGSHPIERN